MITGGCFCGQVRYDLDDGDYTVVNCHCTMCRRISAAPYVTWMIVPVGNVHLVTGEPARLKSSDDGTREFCNSCGTPVFCTNTGHPDIIDVTLCSLDEPAAFTPSVESYTDNKLNWVNDLTSIPAWKEK